MAVNPRGHMQPYLNSSLLIRQEIQRFESVHPSIYAIYDLIEAIPDPLIQQQVREHVVCIEDSFVNSQEWTLSRSVPDLKLGILGSVNSGKSALVHRYLTGSYMQEESPEGGRFKKEVNIDGQSYLLLIRDEGGPPEMQFTHWVDAVIFVFSLENENSFAAVYNYYAKMAHYRNTAEVPLILVGTQDAISESNPRVINDTRARKLANDLRGSYYETCATYGLNVERVFQDACRSIVQARLAILNPNLSRPSTPNHAARQFYTQQSTPPAKGYDSHSTGSQSSGSMHTATPSSGSSHTLQGHSPTLKEPGKDGKEHRHDKKHRDKDRQKHAQEQAHLQGHAQPSAGEPHLPIHAYSHSGPVPVPCPVAPDVRLSDHTPTPSPITVQNYPPPPPPPVTQISPDRHDGYHPAVATPVSGRKFKKHNAVHKSNSFSGPSVLSNGGERELPTPTSTPVLHRKHRHKSISEEPRDYQDSVTGRNEPRYRLSLVIEKMDSFFRDLQISKDNPLTPILSRIPRVRSSISLDKPDSKDLPTPSSTPTQSRKNRRRSNLFVQPKKEEDKKPKNGELGSGRVIPLKQGYLYKKSTKALNKDWKKKYVTLLDDGRLTYHPSLHDYMDEVHGKEINLVRTTVKVPGQRPRGSQVPRTVPPTASNANGEVNSLNTQGVQRIPSTGCEDGSVVIPNASITPGLMHDLDVFGLPPSGANSKIETPNVKKRHRRAKSGTKGMDPSQDGDSDGYEFIIVSLDNKQWHFEAPSVEEREEWVTAIEQQILSSLQANQSTKSKSKSTTVTDPQAGQTIRAVKGNGFCADCDAANPDWASLNLGALICIECSGVHRNLGTHLSRVRSLDLDEWPPDLVTLMACIGNTVANSVWEADLKGKTKPVPRSSREEKENWIRAKYEKKEFLPPTRYQDVPLGQQLIDAVARQDLQNLILVLGHCTIDDVNAPYSKSDTRTALHIAAALGNAVFVQLLLWYGANVKVVDHECRNALYYARISKSQECTELLRTNGCPEHPTIPRRRTSSQPSGQSQSASTGQAGQTAQTGQTEAFEKLPSSVI